MSASVAGWDPDRPACLHAQYACLRCGNTGCTAADCPACGFLSGLCRSCGHFEKRQL
ncbi:MAG: hypothetical protein ACYCO3_01665 [Mycobacteriales bacterium]